MKKQIVLATVAGALVAGIGLLMTQPVPGAASDVHKAFWPAVTAQGQGYGAR